MKLVMENWRKFEHRQSLIENSEYITDVLGVRLPLNESYPYSAALTEEILREQMLFEAFWDPIIDWGKSKAGQVKGKVAGLPQAAARYGKDFANTMLMIYKAFTGEKIHTYVKALRMKLINRIQAPIYRFLDLLIGKGPEWNMPTFAQWAQKTKSMIEDGFAKVDALDGWKKALGLTTLGLGLRYLWDKVGSQVSEILELAGSGAYAPRFDHDELPDFRLSEITDVDLEKKIDRRSC